MVTPSGKIPRGLCHCAGPTRRTIVRALKRASHGVLAFATAYNNAETKIYHARANNSGTEAGGVDKLVLS